MNNKALWLLPLSLLLAACSPLRPTPRDSTDLPPPRSEPTSQAQRLVMEPIKLQALPGKAVPDIEAIDADTLFEQAGQLLSGREYRRAVANYDRLLKEFPDSRLAASTLYNAGLCHEWLGEFDRAALRYAELIRRFGERKEAIDAAFRLGGCHAELQNWPASAEVFKALQQRSELSIADRIEAMAREGLAHFRLGDERACRSTLEGALRYYKTVEAVERLDSDFFLAMIHYYLGALPHVTFRKLQVQAGPELAQSLDEKARQLLLSQARYIEAIKVKNAYWATAAGFQIGSLYREFYTVLLTSIPDFTREAQENSKKLKITKDEAERQLVQVYMEEVHKAVKPLLTKAINVFERNILMAQRVGVESNWITKSRHQVGELKQLLTLPPEEAVKLVKRDGMLPEDQPVLGADPDLQEKEPSPPETTDPAPARPSDTPSPRGDDQPGRAVM